MLYGFDVGGTKIAFSVYDQALTCHLTEQITTPSDYPGFITAIAALVKRADQRFACKGLVGIGFPGAISGSEQRVNCANVAAIKGQTLAADLSGVLDREIKLENDANCFLLSECYGGSADNCSAALAITLGTGIGAAVFVNGAIHRGLNSFAGEIGHYPIAATMLLKYPDLPLFGCGCGRKMCFETYCSGTGLSNLYHHYAGNNATGPEIISRYLSGDEVTNKVLDIYLELLAAGLATAILVLDPEVIVLGGGLSKLPLLTEQLIKNLPEHLLKNVSLPQINSAMFGATGGVRGAALLNFQP
ncbi:ROK family protein [Psychromonas sp.]|uniref:ROK family protein n=1 Tax=Psychromonas sp. TaxID=1884585 RepID=UPI0035680193